MDNDTQKLIEEQKKKLPPELVEALEATPWKSSIKEIALLNKVPLPQVPEVERETMLILYGFDNPKNYIDNLVKEVGLEESVAISIAEGVNEQIIQVIEGRLNSSPKEEGVIHNPPLPKATEGQDNLPMVEEGEKAHEVPHDTNLDKISKEEVKKEESKPQNPVKTPDYRYPGGVDPYREPIE